MSWQEVRGELVDCQPADPLALGDVHAPGIYAWWDLGGNLSYPYDFPAVDSTRPLYIGIAERQGLDDRGLRMHLKRTRMSGLRRSLAALLRGKLDLDGGVVPARGGMFGLDLDHESVLTKWMLDNLKVTWVEHAAPSQVERAIVNHDLSPLNYEYATRGPYAAKMRILRADLRSSGVTRV